MTIHRIDLMSTRRGERALASYNGEILCDSREPTFDAARELLRRGWAQPADQIACYRGSIVCTQANVGWAAAQTIEENDWGIRRKRYRPFSDRSGEKRPEGPAATTLAGDAETAEIDGLRTPSAAVLEAQTS